MLYNENNIQIFLSSHISTSFAFLEESILINDERKRHTCKL
jgi:hypothetical protein